MAGAGGFGAAFDPLDEENMSAVGSDCAVTSSGTCRPCSNDGESVEGEWYCIDCREILCDACFKYHRKISFLRGHVVKRKDDATPDEMKPAEKDTCIELCEVHEGKVLEYYCVFHEQSPALHVCQLCIRIAKAQNTFPQWLDQSLQKQPSENLKNN